MSPARFVWECVIRQMLWIPSLVRYIRIRAQYANTGGGTGPYVPKGKKSRIPILVGAAYVASLIPVLWTLVRVGNPWLLGLVPAALLSAMMLFFLRAPDRWWPKALLKPEIRPRYVGMMRVSYITLVFTTLAFLTYATDEWWSLYYIVLWIVPSLTVFSFCMLLRQVVQHGNTGTDRLTNTRVFHVGRLIQWAVFPLGMDYHLPHHLFPLVPHYRLRELHALLMETEAYRQQAVVVEGYFFPRERPPKQPTVLDLMSRESH
jgi:hypothetical protein